MKEEHRLAKAEAIRLAFAGIKTLNDVSSLFDQLNSFLAFHPDTDFKDYVNLKEGTPTFGESESAVLNMAINKAIDVCLEATPSTDVYNLCIQSAMFVGTIALAFEQCTDDMQCVEIGYCRSLCCTRGIDDKNVESWELSVIDQRTASDMAPTRQFNTEAAALMAASEYLEEFRKEQQTHAH